MSILQHSTLARLLAQKPRYTAPAVSSQPYVIPEIQVGDAVEVFPGAASGYPIPSNTATLMVGGVPRSPGYVAQTGDIGAVAQVTQPFINELGQVTGMSSAVQVVDKRSAYNEFLIGTNTTQAVNYLPAYYLYNAAQCGGHPGALDGSSISASNMNSTGWPKVAFQFTLTAVSGTSDGQLNHGTYQNCSYTLLTPQPGWTPNGSGSTTVSCSSGGSVSNLQLQADNQTVTFTLTTSALSNVQLSFTGGALYVYVPRDGITPSLGVGNDPEFAPECINYLKTLASVRMMDFNYTIPQPVASGSIRAGQVCVIYATKTSTVSTDYTLIGAPSNITGTVFTATGPSASGDGVVLIPEINWANRVIEYGTTAPGNPFSLEREIRFMNAIANAPGSRIKHIWYNIGAFVSADYAAQFAALLNSLYTGTVPLDIEVGNEPWNTGSTIYPTYSQMAQGECQTIATYGVGQSNLVNATGGSVVGDGTTTTVTIGTGKTMPSFVQVGARFFVRDSSNTPFCTDASSNQYSLSNLATVLSVTATSFTYASKGSGTMTLGDPFRCYFNPTSTLLIDNLDTDIYQLVFKYYVRQMYMVYTQFKAAGRNDRFVMNLQPYAPYGQGNGTAAPIHYKYANWIAGYSVPGTTINTWLYGSAIANYLFAQSRFASASTSNPLQVLGVPWAAYAKAGDPIHIEKVGASGGTLATTVGTGSSGTTLVINDPIQTNYTWADNSPATIYAWDGSDSSTALNAMLYGNIPLCELGIRAHSFACRKWGVRMMCYEASIDLQRLPSMQTSVTSNPLLQTVITKLLDTWYGAGGKELFVFTAVPGVIVNNYAEGAWNWMSSWTDYSSPRMQALVNYTGQRVYNNLFSPSPGAPPTVYGKLLRDVGGVNDDISPSAGTDSNGGSFNTNPTNGMVYWTNNTGFRNAEWEVVFNRSKRYTATISGTDTVAGTVATICIDGVPIGTAVLPASGSPASGSTVPGSVAVVNMTGGQGMDVTGGSHDLSVQFSGTAPYKGAQPGVYSIAFAEL